MPDLKKILILTADAGFGHRSAARAVAAAFEEKYGEECQVEIINPLDDRRTLFLLRDSQADYDVIVRNSPEIYRLGYDVSDAPIPTAIMESTLTLLLFEVLRDLIVEKKPDIIVTTYPLYQAPLDAICKVYQASIPVFTIITDLADVHRIWFSGSLTACLAPTAQIKKQAVASGFPEDRVHITGIPVSPRLIGETRDKTVIRESLGWNPDLPTILVVGSKRVSSVLDNLLVLNHFGRPLQLVVSAGNDGELYKDLQKIEFHQQAHLYEFVENMAEMMQAADAIICKAGGLIVTESLACGLPMLLIDILPGQEMGNAEYVLAGGAGDLSKSQIQTLCVLAHWFLDDANLLKQRAEAAKKMGRPAAAFDAAEIIWNTSASTKITSKLPVAGRPHLLEFLAEHKIDLRETLIGRIK
jgi:1,2-diacylglycerol 3-beta-galactosyltransferase